MSKVIALMSSNVLPGMGLNVRGNTYTLPHLHQGDNSKGSGGKNPQLTSTTESERLVASKTLTMTSYGIWSLLPPLAALGLALWKKQIYPALLLGIWTGWWVVAGWNPVAATGSTVSSVIAVFQDAGNTRILVYSLLVGSVLTLISATGGVEAFVAWVSQRRLVKNRRQAQLVPFLLGILITVESSITALVAGTVGRPLTDRFRVSREKLAYICDSTSAPVCILIPFNCLLYTSPSPRDPE